MSQIGSPETNALIAAVRRVAAQEITPRFRALSTDQIDTKSGADDLVTVADKAAEAALAVEVAKILPNARVIGEEAVAADQSILDAVAAPGVSVIVDPIDGTWNYANGVATYGVIMAVIENGKTVMGLLYDPTCDDWIVSRKGEGAWFKGGDTAPVRLRASSNTGRLEDRFGFVGMYLFDKPGQTHIAHTLPRFRRTQTLRCSCHEYRMMAQGRADFVLNGMLNVWDHAAGVLTLQEAGGVARLLDGRDYDPAMRDGVLLTAGTETLWTELAELWAPLVQR